MNSNMNNNGMRNSGSAGSTVIRIVIIMLVLLLLGYFSYKVITDFQNTEADSPYFVEYITDAAKSKQIKSTAVKRSQDGQYGSEFTYSIWLYVKDDNFIQQGQEQCRENYRHIFHKGSNETISTGGKPLLQSPGVWLDGNNNKINIVMNTYYSPYERCDVGNIPINKWFNLTIMLIGNSLDVYINCNLKKRCRLNGVPKLNFDDLWITHKGGFSGFKSRFRYFNYAIEPYKISQICKMGPGTKSPVQEDDIPPYLADDYWTTTGFPVVGGFPEPN